MAYAPNNGGGVSQIIVAVIVGVIWLFNAVMAKVQQGKKKADEPDEQPTAAPAADTQLTEADRSYREIQEEIRRRIARRNNPTAPVAPVQRPAPAPYVRSPNALPPIRSPQPVPTLLRRVAPPPQPAPMAVSDDDEDNRISMPAAPSPKCRRGSFEETKLDWLIISWTCTLPPYRASTRRMTTKMSRTDQAATGASAAASTPAAGAA